MKLMRILVLSWVVALAAGAAAAQDDAEGSKDHPMFSRMPGYAITDYDAQDFAAFDFALDPEKSVEGRYWRIEYGIKDGARKVGPLQIARNHTDPMVRRGGKKLLEDVDAGGGTTVATLANGRSTVWVQLAISNDGEQFTLIVVEEAAMEQKVEFSAAELATALSTTGMVALHDILFETGKATILPASAAALAPVGELLTSDAALKLEIQGHTDNVGGPAANLQLSRDRAAAVKTYLVQTFALDANRLRTKGLGDTVPVADNRTDAGRAQNRRVELVKID
jgi:outer membrane protein OmpA-like peptidoglycan-associated protein